MSWQATNWALTQKTGDVGRKTVLLLLANLADEEGSCFPGQERLAKESEQSVSTVYRQLKRLEADGFIRREHRNSRGEGRGKGRTSDRYYLNLHVAEVPTGQIDRLKNSVPTGQIEVPTGQMETSHRSPVTEEPLVEPSDRTTSPQAPVPDAGDPEIKAGGLVARWVDGYVAGFDTQPHPTLIKKAAGRATALAKDCRTQQHFTQALQMAYDAGYQGLFDLVAGAPVRRKSQFTTRADEEREIYSGSHQATLDALAAHDAKVLAERAKVG